MTKQEAERLFRQEATLLTLGFTSEEAGQLRRISMTLQRWFERECGDGHGCIERTEEGRAIYRTSSGRSWPIADRERGAVKRLRAIMEAHAPLTEYIQGDPRGAALYIIRPGDIPEGQTVDSCYSRGVCVY